MNRRNSIAETFAQITVISMETEDPDGSSRAMHRLLCDNLKLTRRVLTRNLLKKLADLGIGTNEVEKYARGVCRQNVRRRRKEKLIRNVYEKVFLQ